MSRIITPRNFEEGTPAILECDCGEEIPLYGFTNTCECGTDFSRSGEKLAPRSQWGWDTGETVDEILSIDTPGYHMDWEF